MAKIVGGEPAEPGEFPWQVSLQLRGDNFHYCGGSVISPDFIVTAGHCVEGFTADEVDVVAGLDRLSNDRNAQRIPAAELVQHERFSYLTLRNDVAVIRLSSPLTLDQASVNAICLPSADLAAEGTAVVTGWGTTEEGGDVSDVLMKVSVPIVPDDQCDELYGGGVYQSMICAGDVENGGIDSCQGDSGGPFIVPGENNTWQLAGIVSWGNGCAEPGYPGVYTEVSYFVDWIQDKTGVRLH